MNDMEHLIAMLKRAGASFDVEDKSVTIYGWHDNIISFDFDENGMAIKAE
jgi:hypothetical protein